MRWVVSTHEGNSKTRAWRAVIACNGLGAVVDTARMTGRGVRREGTKGNETDWRVDGSNRHTLKASDRLRHSGRVRPTRVCEKSNDLGCRPAL